MVLREGDSVRISVPGAPNLNTIAPIRRDGMMKAVTGIRTENGQSEHHKLNHHG